ncbi:S-adenosyl-L-methionine-dependent methyltransferase [Wallemia mellicola CBS 633.66]|uniref:S-adenosyl-L-methionine-dependent methyltransferase n=1 Tax=Wallemia mellicola (strain ATCC MYA-4683 / CBS 633.66) TaxID=671144 RepID=I4Y6J4_WALMC|nr:S-adenosyl-L-methionine-dependent methyltransferase [Wallemia mellicola CBS 633.66]EIM19586.1 S-adenosyl-L-methionine-dependent methyltransferase [Wallemia mellicola CBS 633.66]|eukprot:XP_006960384.1 S-adenosyl-L-methionine-dependent methyltransferase [Wallemia mellicola CBS 633.66]
MTDRAAMQKIMKENGDLGWEAVWKLTDSPPWDNGQVQPLLRHYIENNKVDLPPAKEGVRVLIPGCGKGYDAVYFGSLGYETVGLDLSPEGIRLAEEWYSKQGLNGKTSFICDDFFTCDIGQYDVVYDYTFFCALNPNKRQEYKKRMAELVKPGGLLLSIVFPIEDRPIEGEGATGPPWCVSPEYYNGLIKEEFKWLLNEYPPIEVDNRNKKRFNIFKREF